MLRFHTSFHRFRFNLGRRVVASVVPAALAAGVMPAAAQVDTTVARRWFAEADALCRRDGGRLWGRSVCGPMVIADPATRTLATSEPAPDAPRPQALGFANTALSWGDRRWSTFVWQTVPRGDSALRGRMLLHELFHRVQPDLGLMAPDAAGDNAHLDTPDGRYWLQLEWRALGRALRSAGAMRDAALRDALGFRAARRNRFPGAAESERVAEVNEGLAQYTGTVLSSGSHAEAVASALAQLDETPAQPSLVRTFPYPTGAAYGILLDEIQPGWNRRFVVGDDLGQVVMRAAGLALEPGRAGVAAAAYGGPELRQAEDRREAERLVRVAELRRRFVEGPVLTMPRGRGASFLTAGVTPLPGAGTVFPSFRVTGEWGRLEADAVLMSADGSTLTVPGPVTINGATLSGTGWTVTLVAGWIARPGPRPGDFRIERATP